MIDCLWSCGMAKNKTQHKQLISHGYKYQWEQSN